MDRNPLLKYMMKDKKEDVVHSSAYANAQNGGAFGSSSSQSFEKRMEIDKNRKIVRGYQDSKIAASTRVDRTEAKKYIEEIINRSIAEAEKERQFAERGATGMGKRLVSDNKRSETRVDLKEKVGGYEKKMTPLERTQTSVSRFGSISNRTAPPPGMNRGISR